MFTREESIGRWISILYRSSQTWIANELSPCGIGKGQHTFLAELFLREGVSQGELARSLYMDKGAVAHALLKLERAGYVQRQRDLIDRRITHVYLTEKARSIKTTIFSVLSTWTETLAGGFTDEERLQTLKLLQRMAENAAHALSETRNDLRQES